MSLPASPHAGLGRWERRMLPGGLLDRSDARRSPRDWVVDVLMTVLATAMGAALLGTTWDLHDGPEGALDILAGVLCIAALWFRRSHPVAVGVATGIVSTFATAAGGAGLIALFSAAVRAPWRGLGLVVAVAAVTTCLYPFVYPSDDESLVVQLLFGVLLTVVVIGWGLFARARRELVLSLHDRAERLEAEQRLHVEQARDAERRRIAGEMHDVLAHRVSLLSLHAGALEFRPDASREEIAHAAGVIRDSAHAVLQELREVVGVLRDGEDGTERPQPTLADVPELVRESRAAGMRVACRIDTELADDVPPAVGRTAYRIVQEGLTNARKHAPAAAVEVAIGAEPGVGLAVEVISRRAVGAGAAAPEAPGTGSGLIGLSERVALAGGRFRHGPDGGGDFVLQATLPLS